MIRKNAVRKLSANKKQEIMIATAMISGSSDFCKLVGDVAKGIDVRCKRIKVLIKYDPPRSNAEVLANDLIDVYNKGTGSFSEAFKGCYGNTVKGINVYHERLYRRICNALQSVYSSGNTLAGMPEAEAIRGIELFWGQLV